MSDTSLALLEQRLASLIEKQTDLTVRLDRLTETLESRYVPRSEFEVIRSADDARFRELEKDNDTAAAFRRQVLAGFLVGFLLMLVTAVGVVNNMTG